MDLYQIAQQAPDGLSPVPEPAGSVPPGCLLDLLGIRLTDVGPGRSRARMRLGDQHLNQRGVPQGGSLVAFADAAAGWASYGALPEGNFTTVQLGCHFLAAAAPGTELVALAEPVHLGSRMLVLEVRVLPQEQEGADRPRLAARFTCTQLIVHR